MVLDALRWGLNDEADAGAVLTALDGVSLFTRLNGEAGQCVERTRRICGDEVSADRSGDGSDQPLCTATSLASRARQHVEWRRHMDVQAPAATQTDVYRWCPMRATNANAARRRRSRDDHWD